MFWIFHHVSFCLRRHFFIHDVNEENITIRMRELPGRWLGLSLEEFLCIEFWLVKCGIGEFSLCDM